MTTYTLAATVDRPYDATVERVRDLLGDAGFGVLTEIDLAATLHAKLGVEVVPRLILGACRPELAYRAVDADPRLATMLPCNVVIASERDGRTKVEIFDPIAMTSFSGAPDVANVAQDARTRLSAMLATLGETTEGAADAVGA
jgi:uncharacterized protein (DUF302 family)